MTDGAETMSAASGGAGSPVANDAATAILERAWTLRDVDPPRAASLVAELGDADLEGRASAHRDIVLGFLRVRAGEHAGGLRLGLDAETILHEPRRSAWPGRLSNLLGKAYSEAGLMSSAFEVLTSGIALAEDAGDGDTLFANHVDLALVLHDMEDHRGAEASFGRAERHVDGLPDRRTSLITSRARCLAERDRLDEALDLLADVADPGPDRPPSTADLDALVLRAAVAARRGAAEAARRSLERAERLSTTLERPSMALTVAAARLEALDGDADAASKSLDGVEELCRRHDVRPPPDLARLRIELAVERGDYRRAYQALDSLRSREAEFRARNQAGFHELRLVHHSTELRRQTAALERTNRELAESMAELRHLHDQVVELSVRDPLTGVFNRRQLFVEADLLMRLARRHERAFSVAMVDIDHFKAVNDEHLHATGDQVLRRLATILSEDVRESDVVGRYGGDEFVILLPEVELAGAKILCGRIRRSVEQHDWRRLEPGLSVTVSIGVAAASTDESAQALLSRADQRLYEAKSAGRNRVVG